MTNLKMGFGRVDFTPDGPVYLNSEIYGTVIAEHLFATAIAWQDGDLTVLQFSLDLRNIYDRFYNMLHAAVAEATGLPKDRILIAVTHNHSAPDIACFDKAENVDWMDRIGIPAVCKAGNEALADLAPVTGAVAGKATTHKVGFVRRYFRADGSFTGICIPGNVESPIVRHESQADPELRAVRFYRAGKKDIVMVNFQTHAAHELSTHRSNIGADFVGFMREVVEADGDVLSVYCQGACGNVNTFTNVSEEKEGWPEHYWKIGQSIGESAKEALANAKPLPLGKLKMHFGELECKVNHAKSHLADKAKEIRQEKDPARKEQMMQEAGIGTRYEVSAIIKRSQFPETRMMPVAALACGEFAEGFAPVELFDTCGKEFRDASCYDTTFFCGYALGSHSYMPSALAFPNVGYEALECHYVPGTGEMIALELAHQLRDLRKA